jgi:hypothetical protein
MSQSGYTPIQLYRTTTAAAVPTAGNLAAGELAINLTDEALYFKNAAGVVKLLADSSGALGTVTSVDVSGGTTGLTTSGGPITSSGTITLAGTLGVANGGTGTATAFTAGSVVFAGASGVYSQDNANLFWDNANDRLGIGTATPSAKLEVVGNVLGRADNATGNSTLIALNMNAGNNTTKYSSLLLQGTDTVGTVKSTGLVLSGPSDANYVASYMTFSTRSADALGERMRITSAGDVGIGTSAPAAKLDVKGNNQVMVLETTVSRGAGQNYLTYKDPTGNKAFLGYADSVSDTFYVYNALNSSMTFSTNALERMRIDASGNVSIGAVGAFSIPGTKLSVTNPSANAYLSVYGGAGSTDGGILLGGNNAENFANIFYSTSSNYVQIAATPAGSQLKFDTAGAERMRITSAGFVGVGTGSPGAQFENMGQTRLGANLTPVAPSSTDILSTANSAFGGNGGNYLTIGLYPGAQGFAQWIQSSFSNPTTAVYNLVLQPLGGNVGIGTASPSQKLDIGGGGNLRLSGASTGDQSIRVGTSRSGNGYSFIDLQGDTTYDNGLRIIRTNGGANTPSHIEHRGTGALALITQEAGPIAFLTSATERARIDSSGNLLVGRTAGGSGTGFEWNTAFGGYTLTSSNGIAGVYDRIGSDGQIVQFRRSGTEVGNISVTTTATAYNTSSDYRLKEIDGPIANSGAYIDALKPVQGSWKADGSRFIGLLAHEVQEVSETPIATGEKDGEKMQAMDYSAPELIANLIAEIQSLRARVAQLEGN